VVHLLYRDQHRTIYGDSIPKARSKKSSLRSYFVNCTPLKENAPQRHKDHEGFVDNNRGTDPSRKVIGLAIQVHRHLGPGLLESAYEECLCLELRQAGIPHTRQEKLPLRYRGFELDCRYQMDLVVDNSLVVEIKSVDKIAPIHQAQLMTYLRLSGHRLGLLMNFNCVMLKDGIVRRVI
jgi:GxxExxY protein